MVFKSKYHFDWLKIRGLVILQMITSFVNAQDSLLTLEQLGSKPFYNKSQIVNYQNYHPEVYRIAIDVSHYRNMDSIELFAHNFPNVQEVIIGDEYMHFPEVILQFKKLQILDFIACVSDDCESMGVFTLPDEMFELKHLKILKMTQLSNIMYISEKIGQLTELIHLELDSYFGGPVILPASLSFSPKLKTILINRSFDFSRYSIYTENQPLYFPFYFPNTTLLDEELNFILATHDHKLNTKFMSVSDMDKSYTNITTFESTLNSAIDKKIQHRYKDGKLAIKGRINNAFQPIGTWKYYYQNGALKEERHYQKGKETGIWSVYDSLGTKLMNFYFPNDSVSFFHVYFPDGTLSRESFFNNNEAIGTWRMYKPNGTLYFERKFENNKLNGISIRDVNEYSLELNHIDQVQYIETNYVNGKREGIEFGKNYLGEIIMTRLYKNNQLVSEERNPKKK